MGNSLDDVSDRDGFTRPKKVRKEHYGLGCEINVMSRGYFEEYLCSPMQDCLFISLTRMLEYCEAVNGFACDGCKSRRKCVQLFDQISMDSVAQTLDAGKVRVYIEKMEQL